jgi:uncharacterized protein YlxW (UPF0749 family)
MMNVGERELETVGELRERVSQLERERDDLRERVAWLEAAVATTDAIVTVRVNQLSDLAERLRRHLPPAW